MKTIDATGLILGRLSTRVAKMALMGEQINVVNCEKAVISGNKYNLFNEYQELRDKGGPFHGPFVQRLPDKFVKRVIRSMLPYKNERGRIALKLIKCYINIPEELKDSEMISFPEISKETITRTKIVTVGEISKSLGAKYNG